MTINPVLERTTQQILAFLELKSCFDSFLLTGMIIINFQEEFDTINHDILSRKLSIIGF